MPTAGYPIVRPRRLRANSLVRDMVRETTLDVRDFILPLFVRPGTGVRQEISSMPGNYQLSVDRLIDEVGSARELGIRAFILFGIPVSKDATGSSALRDDGIVQREHDEIVLKFTASIFARRYLRGEVETEERGVEIVRREGTACGCLKAEHPLFAVFSAGDEQAGWFT